MPYTVYILHSDQLSKYYVGHTADLIKQRLRRHLTDHDGFTSKAKDWQLVYQEFFEDKKSAATREREIKSWKSARRITALIENSKSR
ncbi:GIY-YIG nuclease family protein [Flavitalea antarctica]